MSFSVYSTSKFEKELKKLSKKFPSLKKEYPEFLISLKEDPQQGIPLGKECYKIRLSIASKGKGKSAGARVITYVYIAGKAIYLLSIYDKSEKETLTPNELEYLLKSI